MPQELINSGDSMTREKQRHLKIIWRNTEKAPAVEWLGSLVHGAEAKQAPFIWRPIDVMGLADVSCTFCTGSGFRERKHLFTLADPCICVLRSIFRQCHRKFLQCQYMPKVRIGSFRQSRAAVGKRFSSMKREEFRADFSLIARRVLTDVEGTLFAEYYLRGADVGERCRILGTEGQKCVASFDEIEEKCGRAFRETRPYSLFPISEYFAESSFIADECRSEGRSHLKQEVAVA